MLKKVDSSDYIKTKRQTTIAQEFVRANTNNTFYPRKTNGLVYNKNFKFIPTTPTSTTDASNCVIFAKSYDLLYGFNHGKLYNYNRCQCNTNPADQGECQAQSNCLLLGKCCLCVKCAFI